MKIDPKGWQLFESCFEKHDEVVAIDVFDVIHWGRLEDITDYGCELVRPGGHRQQLSWDDIRFMAHDGFPVRKILGADGSSTIERLDTADTQAAIRHSLGMEFPRRQLSRLRFGDPFDVEPTEARLFHSGNSGLDYWGKFAGPCGYYSEAHRELGHENEEVLVLRSKDGAMAELWDMTTIYMVEIGAV